LFFFVGDRRFHKNPLQYQQLDEYEYGYRNHGESVRRKIEDFVEKETLRNPYRQNTIIRFPFLLQRVSHPVLRIARTVTHEVLKEA
jgi:hypothetical protein